MVSRVEFDRIMAELNQKMMDSQKALIEKMNASIALLTQQFQRLREAEETHYLLVLKRRIHLLLARAEGMESRR